MDVHVAGSPFMFIFVMLCLVCAAIAADKRAHGMLTFFGLLSLILTMLFCAAQIILKK